MATVNVDLPGDLVSVAKLDQGNVSQEAAEFIALELFWEGTVSAGRAAELSATPLGAYMDFVAAHGVPTLNYGMEQFDKDRLTLSMICLWGRAEVS